MPSLGLGDHMALVQGATRPVNFNTIDVNFLTDGAGLSRSSTTFVVTATSGGVFPEPPPNITLTGAGFRYDAGGHLVGGVVTGYLATFGSSPDLRITGLNFDVSLAQQWTGLDLDVARTAFLRTLFSGDDTMTGSSGRDYLFSYGGNDSVIGGAGDDTVRVEGNATVYGGDGADFLSATLNGDHILWGEAGDDNVTGGEGWDYLHGNQGDDHVAGNGGDDWVMGGQGRDAVYGGRGNDLVYGNMGADSCYGGQGDDRILGGQDQDQLWGEDGADFLSGDRGSDTLSGGAGADIFYAFAGSGVERILDFNYAEGDRVQLFGTRPQSIVVSGNSTIITTVDGDEIVLVGVTAPLPQDAVQLL